MLDKQKACEVIAETVGCDIEKVTPEARLEEDLGADSLAAMELVMALEDQFDVTIEDADLEQIKTVAALLEHLEANAQ